MHQLRLHCSLFHVDVRLRDFSGRWLASAGTPDGPSLGWGTSAIGGAVHGLGAVRGVIEELLVSLPHELAAKARLDQGR